MTQQGKGYLTEMPTGTANEQRLHAVLGMLEHIKARPLVVVLDNKQVYRWVTQADDVKNGRLKKLTDAVHEAIRVGHGGVEFKWVLPGESLAVKMLPRLEARRTE